MTKWILVWCLLSGCFSSNRSQPPATTTVQLKSQTVQTAYKVIGIRDGDTFELLMDGKEQAVRLAHIDCPERRQPFGTRARQYASDLCFGQLVTLLHQGKYDRYKRLIAEVILKDGRNVNKELVKAGLAWHYKQYSDDKTYALLEAKARKAKVGLWADKHPIAPWDWR